VRKIQISIFSLITCLSTPIFSNPIIIDNILIFTPPEKLNITYQFLPEANQDRKILVSKDGDNLRYYISINQFPTPVNMRFNTEKWISDYKLIVKDISGGKPIEYNNEAKFISNGGFEKDGFDVNYIEYFFTPSDTCDPIRHIAYILANKQATYMFTVVLANSYSALDAEIMLNETISLMKTASLNSSSTRNISK